MFGFRKKDKLYDIVAYLYQNINDKRFTHISRAIFLSDWKYCLSTGERLTKICWEKSNATGVFSSDLGKIDSIINSISRKPDKIWGKSLSKDAIFAMDHVVEVVNRLGYQESLMIVFSTYPIITSDDRDIIDIVYSSKQYQLVKVEPASS